MNDAVNSVAATLPLTDLASGEKNLPKRPRRALQYELRNWDSTYNLSKEI
jgi:hypothetical protein